MSNKEYNTPHVDVVVVNVECGYDASGVSGNSLEKIAGVDEEGVW